MSETQVWRHLLGLIVQIYISWSCFRISFCSLFLIPSVNGLARVCQSYTMLQSCFANARPRRVRRDELYYDHTDNEPLALFATFSLNLKQFSMGPYVAKKDCTWMPYQWVRQNYGNDMNSEVCLLQFTALRVRGTGGMASNSYISLKSFAAHPAAVNIVAIMLLLP